jgi:hypothetical protein
MPMKRASSSALALLLPLAFATSACTGDDDDGTDEVGETDDTGEDTTEDDDDTTTTTTTTDDGDTTESEDTSDDESPETSETADTETDTETDTDSETDTDTGDEKPELGSTPNVQCEGALVNLATIRAENLVAEPDPMTVEMAYVDTALQDFVQQAGALLGRIDNGVLIDDAAILESIDAASSLDLIDVEWRIYLVMHLYVRAQTSNVSGTLPDPNNDPALLYAKWDAAWCYWDGALRPLGQTADMIGPEADESIEATIDAGFAWGHDNIEGEQPWAVDEWELPAARQQVEKSLYTLFHRLVHGWSIAAQQEGDTFAGEAMAHQAYGAFQPLEDRMAGRNTPGIAIIEEQLLASPAVIDPDNVLRQMNIAFAKRVRRYSNHALPDVDATMGTAPGYVAGVEGKTYGRLIDSYMVDALDGFDLASHRLAWETWVDAIEADDLATAETASAELVDWNCQYQAFLGIAECTGSADEPAP